MDAKTAIKQHMLALDTFRQQFTTLTVDFNDIVIESVKLLWEHGQISVVNRTIDTLEHMKGADMRALASYYKKVIPHVFDGNLNRFSKKNPAMVKKMEGMYMDYILVTDWYDLSKTKDAKPYELDIAKVLKFVETSLTKGHDSDSGDQITNEKLDQLAIGMNKILEKFDVQGAIEEMETTDEQLASNIEKLLNTNAA